MGNPALVCWSVRFQQGGRQDLQLFFFWVICHIFPLRDFSLQNLQSKTVAWKNGRFAGFWVWKIRISNFFCSKFEIRIFLKLTSASFGEKEAFIRLFIRGCGGLKLFFVRDPCLYRSGLKISVCLNIADIADFQNGAGNRQRQESFPSDFLFQIGKSMVLKAEKLWKSPLVSRTVSHPGKPAGPSKILHRFF